MVVEIVGLEICIPDLIWTVIDFFILFFLLKIFLFKPLINFMDRRNAKIESGLAKGRMAKEQMDQAEAEADVLIGESSLKARQIVDNTRKDGMAKRAAEALETKKTAKGHEAEMIQSIEQEKGEIQSKTEENIPDYVSMLTKRILGEDNK